jgi:hypothetical protein
VAAPVRKATADLWAEQGGRHVHAGIEVQNGDSDTEFRYGTKFAMLATRPNTLRNNRVILDVEAVPAGKGYGGEARTAVDIIDRVIADPDVRCDGLCHDGAFRGKHSDHAMKRGLTVLSPLHDGTGKPAAFDRLDCGCGEVHDLWTQDGRICERQVLDTGETASAAMPDRQDLHAPQRQRQLPLVCRVRHALLRHRAPRPPRHHRDRCQPRLQPGRAPAPAVKTDTGDSVYDRC